MLIATLTLAATLIGLTPERPVAPISQTSAVAQQDSPSVATNAHGTTIAVWSDSRVRRQTCDSCLDVYASHLDRNGNTLEPFGVRLREDAWYAKIASIGNDFLVVYNDRNGTWSWLLDENLHQLADPIQLANTPGVIALGTNGTTYLAATQNSLDHISLIELDATGHALRTTNLNVSSATFSQTAIVTTGSRYHFIHENFACAPACTAWIEDTILSDGFPVTLNLGAVGSQYTQIAAASTGSTILIATATDQLMAAGQFNAIEVQLIDADGHIIAPRKLIATTSSTGFDAGNIPAVLWDGSQFLAVWERRVPGAMQLVGVHVSASGNATDANPFVVAPIAPAIFQGGPTATGNLILFAAWDGASNNIYSVNVADPAAALVTYSAPQQSHAAISGSAIAWLEETKVFASMNGSTPVLVANTVSSIAPAVSQLGNVSLITWIDWNTEGVRILGARMRGDGTLIDRFPIVIAMEPRDFGLYPGWEPISVTNDGTNFFVAWSAHADVHARRVAVDGSVIDASSIAVIQTENPGFVVVPNVRAVWTGSEFLVAATLHREYGLLISPSPFTDTIVTARVTRDGVALDATAPRALASSSKTTLPVTIAAGGGRVLAAWPSREYPNACIVAQLLDSGETRQLACGTFDAIHDVDVTWDGSAFIVLSSEKAGDSFVVHGRHFEGGDAFDLSPAGTDAFDVSASGTNLAYTRVTPAAGNVGRVYTRSILRRGRAVAR